MDNKSTGMSAAASRKFTFKYSSKPSYYILDLKGMDYEKIMETIVKNATTKVIMKENE